MRTEHVADSPDWDQLDETAREEIRAWMRSEGIDPQRVTRVRLVGEGAVEVDRYLLNEAGAPYCVALDGSPLPEFARDWPEDIRMAEETVTVAVSTPPPDAWWS